MTNCLVFATIVSLASLSDDDSLDELEDDESDEVSCFFSTFFVIVYSLELLEIAAIVLFLKELIKGFVRLFDF